MNQPGRFTAVVQVVVEQFHLDHTTVPSSDRLLITSQLASELDVVWKDDLVDSGFVLKSPLAPVDIHLLITVGLGSAAGAAAIEFVKGAAGEAGKQFWTVVTHLGSAVLHALTSRNAMRGPLGPSDLQLNGYLVIDIGDAMVAIDLVDLRGHPEQLAGQIDAALRHSATQWENRWPETVRSANVSLDRWKARLKGLRVARKPTYYVWFRNDGAEPITLDLGGPGGGWAREIARWKRSHGSSE